MKKILISACLLGTPCRYDGGSKRVFDVTSFGADITLYPYCPECEGGLPTPRVPAERVGERVITKDGRDVTNEYMLGAKGALELCKKEGIKIAILKKNSPSCGKDKIYDGTYTGTLVDGVGTAAEMLMQNGITVYTEDEGKKFTI